VGFKDYMWEALNDPARIGQVISSRMRTRGS